MTSGEDQTPHEQDKKPVVFDANNRQKALNVAMNLAYVYGTDEDTVNRDADISTRQGVLRKMGVEPSWYSEDELTGKNGPSWSGILEAARNDEVRKVNARNFEQSADFGRPLSDLGNQKLLERMATNTENKARTDAREKQKKAQSGGTIDPNLGQKINTAEDIEKERIAREAEQEVLRTKIEESESLGAVEGQRLATRVYDPSQRGEVEAMINGIVNANRGSFLKKSIPMTQDQVMTEIDFTIVGFSNSVFAGGYLKTFERDFRREHKRKPTEQEIEVERERIEGLSRDLRDIRWYESDGTIRVPTKVAPVDMDIFTRPRELDQLAQDARDLRDQRERAFRVGFGKSYNEVRSQDPFTEENRPWYMTTSPIEDKTKR